MQLPGDSWHGFPRDFTFFKGLTGDFAGEKSTSGSMHGRVLKSHIWPHFVASYFEFCGLDISWSNWFFCVKLIHFLSMFPICSKHISSFSSFRAEIMTKHTWNECTVIFFMPNAPSWKSQMSQIEPNSNKFIIKTISAKSSTNPNSYNRFGGHRLARSHRNTHLYFLSTFTLVNIVKYFNTLQKMKVILKLIK